MLLPSRDTGVLLSEMKGAAPGPLWLASPLPHFSPPPPVLAVLQAQRAPPMTRAPLMRAPASFGRSSPGSSSGAPEFARRSFPGVRGFGNRRLPRLIRARVSSRSRGDGSAAAMATWGTPADSPPVGAREERRTRGFRARPAGAWGGSGLSPGISAHQKPEENGGGRDGRQADSRQCPWGEIGGRSAGSLGARSCLIFRCGAWEAEPLQVCVSRQSGLCAEPSGSLTRREGMAPPWVPEKA